MSNEQYLIFVILRKAKKIGRIWLRVNGFMLAPLDAHEGIDDYSRSEFILESKFLELLDELSGVKIEKKPPMREYLNVREKLGR